MTDWIDDIIDHILANRNGRQVVLWGKYIISEQIAVQLKEEYDIEVAFYVVSSDRNPPDNGIIKPSSYLNGKAADYYVAVPLAFHQSIKDALTVYGFQTGRDYYYFCDCIVEQREDYYKDAHGNQIFGKYAGLKFAFSGFGATLRIGEGTVFEKAMIYLHSDAQVSIGNNCTLFKTQLRLLNGGEASIGADCEFREGFIHVNPNARLSIGDRFSVQPRYCMIISEYTNVTIGRDCMFSWDILLMAGDSHSIFDVVTKKNINSTIEESKRRKIVIGNHVWLGARTIILYHTDIGDGSIIGTGSLVKGKIPNNCIAVGRPAKVVRRNVAWSGENAAGDISACGEAYVRMTEDNRLTLL